MEHVRQNLSSLHTLYQIVKRKDPRYFKYVAINQHEITDQTISIVMTSHERSKQVYYTLDTINACAYKDIQVILVDDSIRDPVDVNRLYQYEFAIELIRVNRSIKCWSNPCVNYNIGFEFIRGGKVIIQNSEVCYIGDILSYVHNTIIDDKYYVFDVKASRNHETNELIYKKKPLTITIYNEDIWDMWYQHYTHRNFNYHFLCAVTRSTFDKIGGFSYDYSYGTAHDDNDFLIKINQQQIAFVNVYHDVFNIGGIHLFHGYNMPDKRAYESPSNNILCEKKQKYVDMYHTYIELSSYTQPDELVRKFMELYQV
jgi:hypothetical protein